MSGGVLAVFLAVIGARFILPLFILKYPLPAIIACLILDGIDQTIFQSMGYDPPGYQGYDKAMDVFYLAIGYLATMRNWISLPAFRVGRFLYFYRLVGVVAFELTALRPLLLIFPNTFEYFFIAYEAIRSRWSPLRLLLTGWITTAALIWVFIKLPQEWWIHIAKLDVTEILAANAWATPTLVGALVVLAGVFWFVIRPRLPQPNWSWRFVADPLPEEMDTAHEQSAWHARFGAMWSWATFEKVFLVGLLAVIFSKSLPGVKATPFQLFVGIAVVVLANALFTLVLARRSVTIASIGTAFVVRTVANILFVIAADWLLGREGGDLGGYSTLFFLTLISLVTTLHDRYRPVLATRVMAERAAAGVS